MIGIDTDLNVEVNAEDVIKAYRERLMDAATKGFAVSQERVPQDRGTLQQSGFPPERRGNDIVYGYTAPYARPIEEGTDAFYPPIQPLLEWAERIGKDRGFGYYVARKKIPEEGVDAHPYLKPSAEAVKDYLKTHDLEF